MRIHFLDKKLAALYEQGKGADHLDPAVYEAFLDVVASVQAARDTLDLRALKWLHYEKLRGDRQGDRSMRLHEGRRLIVREHRDAEGVFIEIVAITDYHRRER